MNCSKQFYESRFILTNRRIVLAGKGHIACEALNWLVKNYTHKLISVLPSHGDVTTPQSNPSVTNLASLSDVRIISNLEDYKLDRNFILLSLEYDKIIDVKNLASNSLYNLHFSALPKYRGVYTSTWPILNGETHTGVTLHRIDAGIDTGPIIAQDVFEINNSLTAFDLYNLYQKKGSELILSNLPCLVSKTELVSYPQRTSGTYYNRGSIDFSNFSCDFSRSAQKVHNTFRAFIFPEYQLPEFQSVKIIRSEITENRSLIKPGLVVAVEEGHFEVSTLDYNVNLYIR